MQELVKRARRELLSCSESDELVHEGARKILLDGVKDGNKFAAHLVAHVKDDEKSIGPLWTKRQRLIDELREVEGELRDMLDENEKYLKMYASALSKEKEAKKCTLCHGEFHT